MVTAVAEEYLVRIYNVTMEGDAVIAARLAEKFGVSRATVSETVKRLIADGYVESAADHSLALTPAGRQLTEKVLRRHRLAERLLFEVLGMDWVTAHEQAHSLEHSMTDVLEQSISERLGHPQTCPHGNPIPGNTPSGDDFLRNQHAFRLSDSAPGRSLEVVLISEVVEDETAILRRLGEIGIRPLTRLDVVEAEPGSAIVFRIGQEVRSVPRDLASKIWVKPTAENEPENR